MLRRRYPIARVRLTRALLLNEQVFLGWVRAAVALLGLGFALDRFDLSLSAGTLRVHPASGHHISGLLLMASGLWVLMWALWRYWRVRRSLLRGGGGPRTPADSPLPQAVGVVVSLLGLRLLFHLFHLWPLDSLHLQAVGWGTWPKG